MTKEVVPVYTYKIVDMSGHTSDYGFYICRNGKEIGYEGGYASYSVEDAAIAALTHIQFTGELPNWVGKL